MLARAFGLFAFVASAAFAAPQQPLQPIEPWVLDYAAAHCIASREYGRTSAPIVLAIVPSPNLESYELSIIKSRTGPWFANELQGSIDFGHGPIKAWLLHYGKPKKDVQRYRLSAADMEQARAASSVNFTAEGESKESFSLESMPDLLNGLKDCTQNLQQYWNFPPERLAGAGTPARGDLRSLFSSSDFPPEAVARRQEGTAQFLLLIDEQGKVAACYVEKTSGVPDFDAMGCAVIEERARFIPARDASGKPVRSAATSPPVSWRLR